MTAPVTIGIDLGTANSRVAIHDDRGARVIEDAEGSRALPSIVAVRPDRRTIVGAAARRATLVPANVLATPADAAARLLAALAQMASAELGAPVTRAAVAVEAGLDEAGRRALRDAGRAAGIEVVRLINASTAAALAYAVAHPGVGTIAVVDVGADTAEVAIVRCDDGLVEVLGRADGAAIGGRTCDERIANLVRQELLATAGIELGADRVAMRRLLLASEAARRALSRDDEATIVVPNLVLGPAGAISLARPITASELEGVTGDLVARVVELGGAALADAQLDPAAIEAVVAVGGVTRAPSLRRAIAAMFPAPPARLHPEETIAIGAALEGAILDGRAGDIAVVDRLARAIGFRAAPDRFVPVVPRAAVLPARTRKVFPTGGDPRKRIAFEIYEGNAALATQNRRLGRVRLADPEPTDRVDHLEVVFTVDASGWLGITARDLRSGRAWSVERE